MKQAFEEWFQGGTNKQKLERINGGYKLSSAHLSWIAWQAASQHYEAKLAEMQDELDKEREFIKKAFIAHPNLDMDIDFWAKDK